jgi:hypothetical protein
VVYAPHFVQTYRLANMISHRIKGKGRVVDQIDADSSRSSVYVIFDFTDRGYADIWVATECISGRIYAK